MKVWLGMGWVTWVGSWVYKFTWQWVGLGQLFGGLGWVDENRPTDSSDQAVNQWINQSITEIYTAPKIVN